jgi:hypothetical protein
VDVWFRLVSGFVARYLDDLVARSAAAHGAHAPLAGELVRVATAWRALLRMHHRMPGGGCAVCGKSHTRALRRLGLRRRVLPDADSAPVCTVWQVAIGYFVRRVPGDEPGSVR